MVSRRKILSRSRDDLNLDQTFSPQEEEEDVWYQKDKLYKEHIQEVLDKWTQIDDEIWAKVIVFERNRRVAKAYARAPVLTINGSDDGFDGMRIGLCGFDNPMRDQKTDELKRHIGQGVKIKMDDAGNILIRRYAKSNVYVKSTASSPNEETAIGAEILKLPNQALESEKIVKLFDMKKFQSNVNRELRRAYPDRRRLETQCLSAVAFVKSENDILECPIWVLIVNVVAMDMLKSKLPPAQRPMVDIKNRPRIPIPDEDDPYSVAGNGSGGSSGSSGFGSGHQALNGNNIISNGNNGSGNGLTNGGGPTNATIHLNNGSGHVAATREQLLLQTQQLAHKRSEKPPKLPPRDNIYSHDLIPKPDYDDIEVDSRIKLSRGKSDKGKDNKKYDDPYYCGLRARVPNFVKSSKPAKDHKELVPVLHNGGVNGNLAKKTSMIHMPMGGPLHMHPHHIQQQQLMAAAAAHAIHHPAAHHHHHTMWQTRSYESGIGSIFEPVAPGASHTSFHIDRTDLTMGAGPGPVQEPDPGPGPIRGSEQASASTGQDYALEPDNALPIHHHPPPYAHRPERNDRQRYGHRSPPPYQQPGRHLHHSRNCARRQQRHILAAPQPQPLMDERHYARTTLPPIPSNCNCVSCHALAPLFGAALPDRPSRSLSQQQLRQHHRLSGTLIEGADRTATGGLIKWCSESDISELDHGQAVYEYPRYEHPYILDDFDMGEKMRSDNGTHSMKLDIDMNFMRPLRSHKRPPTAIPYKQSRPPLAAAERIYYGFGTTLLQQHSVGNELHSLPDIYKNMDGERDDNREQERNRDRDRGQDWDPDREGNRVRLRLRQIRSPPPIRSPDDPGLRCGLQGTRHKSASIESFFEQPNEEGSLYLYGGRQRIANSPSTTNIYDRIRNSIDSDRTTLRSNSSAGGGGGRRISNINSNNGVYKQNHNSNIKNNNNRQLAQPPLPPPLLRRTTASSTVLNSEANSNNNTDLADRWNRKDMNNNNNAAISNLSSLAFATKMTARAIARAHSMHSQKSESQDTNPSGTSSSCQPGLMLCTAAMAAVPTEMVVNARAAKPNSVVPTTTKIATTASNVGGANVKSGSAVTNVSAVAMSTATTITTTNMMNNNNNNCNNATNVNNGNCNDNYCGGKANLVPLQTQQSQKHQQQQQQQQQQQRAGRPGNRLDISDMESIYGYLKPRKPRSLSSKKIQILDY